MALDKANRWKYVVSPLIVLSLVFAVFPLQTSGAFQAPEVTLTLDFKGILGSLNYTRIHKHVESLSSLGSRSTGYDGCREASEYIQNAFVSYGLSVQRQAYPLSVPKDNNTAVVVPSQGKVIEAYALWPNSVQTSRTPEPVEGQLICGGHGELQEFNGKVVSGSIVLMEFNSEDNWLEAAKLGAKAVIFTFPPESSYDEARSKFLITPIHFPRVLVSKEDSVLLRGIADKGLTVSVKVDMRYETVEAENIIGVVEGTNKDLRNNLIVVAAHYDTWSVVPKLAPGADEATSAASLLELAKYFARNPPERSIMFVALSGHWNALAGPREFVEKYFFDEKVLTGERKIWAFMSLDFSTVSTEMALLYAGSFYEYTGQDATPIQARWTRWFTPRVYSQVLPSLKAQTGRTYSVEDGFYAGLRGWWASVYGPYMLDSEPFAVAHGLGFTLRTTSHRLHWGHPLSDTRYVNLDNLKPQLEVGASIVYDLATNGVNMAWSDISPARTLFAAGGADLAGYITLKGQVLTFNISEGWYSPVPDAIVVVKRMDNPDSSYPFIRIISKAGEDGNFSINGWGGMFSISKRGKSVTTHIDAYKMSDETGLIEYAPDLGQYGAMQLSFTFTPQIHPSYVSTVVFKSSSIVLFDLVNPIELRPETFLDPRFQSQLQTPWFSAQSLLMCYDFDTMSEFRSWGRLSLGFEDVAMLFVPPNSRALIMYRLSRDLYMAGILVDADNENPEGNGIDVPRNQELHISATSYCFASDMLSITKSRYSKLKAGFVGSYEAEMSLQEAESRLSNARASLDKLDYDTAYSDILLAWAWTIKAYGDTMTRINDTLYVNAIFLSSLMVFSLFVERLLFSTTGKKRLVAILLIYIVFLGMYMSLSPAPRVAANFMMSPLSIGILMLFIFVTSIFFNKVMLIAKEERLSQMGKHYMERGFVSLAFLSFGISTQQMRRRKLRTVLVLITVATIMTSMVALTSTVTYARPSLVKATPFYPAYKGMLLQFGTFDTAPGNIGDPYFLEHLRGIVGYEPSPRVWFYPESRAGMEVGTEIKALDEKYQVRAILGLSKNEVLNYLIALRNGSWLWSDDAPIAVISSDASEKLKISVGQSVEVEGYNLTVVGIIDAVRANSLLDLTGFPSTPVDPNMVNALLVGVVPEEQHNPLTYGDVLIVPYKLALRMGGYLASVSFRAENASSLIGVTNELAILYRGLAMHVCDGENVWTVGPLVTLGFQGLGPILVIFCIGGLVIANTILGTIYERIREIRTFSSLGLSPKGVSLMFMLESLVYALIAIVLGYIMGISLNVSLVGTKMLPPDFFVNSSSLTTILAIGITVLFALVPSLYPALLVSKLVVPSLERKWRIPSKPKGDSWEIILPFLVNREEAKATLRYLDEFLQSHTAETPDPYIVREVKLDLQGRSIISKVALQPFDAGVAQEVTIQPFFTTDESRFRVVLNIKRLSGSPDVWTAMNPTFIDNVRKQFLIWKSLSPKEKERYYG